MPKVLISDELSQAAIDIRARASSEGDDDRLVRRVGGPRLELSVVSFVALDSWSAISNPGTKVSNVV